MKYISLDIETTGLDPEKNQIIEVGAVLDEIGSTTPIEDLPKFRAVLLHDEMRMGAYCATLHRDLWSEILVAKKWIYNNPLPKGYFSRMRGKIGCEGDSLDDSPKIILTHYCKPEMFETLFHNWIGKNYLRPFPAEQMRNNPETIKINVAGKNPGTFDIPFLKALPGWQGLVEFRRRVLDPASHCIQSNDEHIPDLQECLKRCGLEGTVSHTAVDDAIDVIRVIRHQKVGKRVLKAVCHTCISPDCSERDDWTSDCTKHTTITAKESSCTKCDATPACGYRDGRNPNNPCGHFNTLK